MEMIFNGIISKYLNIECVINKNFTFFVGITLPNFVKGNTHFN